MIDASAGAAAATVDTAAELNAILASNDALFAWFETALPAQFAQFSALSRLCAQYPMITYSLTLKLPAVPYDGVIEVSPTLHTLSICGSVDGNARTTLPGLRIANNFDRISAVDFVANNGILQKLNKSDASEPGFTCGILCVDTDDRFVNGNGAAGAENCSFRGFTYGMRSTDSGYFLPRAGSAFTECVNGLYIDSADVANATFNNTVFFNRFLNCGTAVKIVALPAGGVRPVTPYAFRVYISDFLNNETDFDIGNDGIFYCYCNYYGSVNDGATAITAETVTSRSARVQEGQNTVVVTNPRCIALCRPDGQNETPPALNSLAARLTGAPGVTTEGLCICRNPALHTLILNSMANVLVVSGFCTPPDAGGAPADVVVGVVGDEGDILGAWTFGGGETT